MSRTPRVFVRAQDRGQLVQKQWQPVHQLGSDRGWSLSLGEIRTRPIENRSTIGDEEFMEHHWTDSTLIAAFGSQENRHVFGATALPPWQIGKSLTHGSGNQSNSFLAGHLIVSGALAPDACQAIASVCAMLSLLVTSASPGRRSETTQVAPSSVDRCARRA